MPLSAPLRILAVDDEPAILQLISAHLWLDGHSVGTADDGVDGLAQFLQEPWDVVLTDRLMPNMGGEHLAAAIKKVNPGTPVIMVTGSLEPAPDDELRLPNVDKIVLKPFSSERLREALSHVTTTPPRLPLAG